MEFHGHLFAAPDFWHVCWCGLASGLGVRMHTRHMRVHVRFWLGVNMGLCLCAMAQLCTSLRAAISS